jgi:hypothetical protein
MTDSVWGKNPELEKLWRSLASGKYFVLVYKDKTYEYVKMPALNTKKYKTMFEKFYEDKEVKAILSSNQSQDAYEEILYPKAKNKSVDYVISHYSKYFKPISRGDKLRVPL